MESIGKIFGNNDKFDEVVISAPSWAEKEGLIEPFLKNAKETLPHFKDGSISLSLHYYITTRMIAMMSGYGAVVEQRRREHGAVVGMHFYYLQ